jgi:hypothetical protein
MVDGGRGGHPTARCLPDDTTMNLCVRRGGPAAQHIGGRATPVGSRSLGFADCLPPVGEKQYWGEKHYWMPPGGLIRHSRRWSATSRSIPDHRALSLTSVPALNAKAPGFLSPDVLSPELSQVALVQTAHVWAGAPRTLGRSAARSRTTAAPGRRVRWMDGLLRRSERTARSTSPGSPSQDPPPWTNGSKSPSATAILLT